MPFDPQRFSGIHSLDVTQAIDAQKQVYWKSGAAVTLTGATATIETHVDSGKQIRGGVEFDIPAADIPHDDGDPTNPRWDTVCVINNNGGIQVFKGTPEPVVFDQDGNELRGEEAYTPSPSDNIPADAIPLAMVWIPAGATNNNDLTDEPTGGVANPVVDRRVTTASKAQQYTRQTVIETAGWYRIAVNGNPEQTQGGDRCMAFFSVRDTQSGFHSAKQFHAGAHFGRTPTITSVGSSHFGNNGAIKRARVIVNGTYDGHALEVYVDPGSRAAVDHVEYTIWQNKSQTGWVPVDWEPGNVPTGFSTTELDFTNSPPLAVASDGKERLRVSRDGFVTAERIFPKEVGTKVTVDSNTIVATNSDKRVIFNTVLRDPMSAYSPNFGEYVTPFDAVYAISIRVGWIEDQDAADAPCNFRMWVRDTDDNDRILAQSFDIMTGDINHVTNNIYDEVELPKGHRIQVYVKHFAGGDVSINDGVDWTSASFRPIGKVEHL